MSPFKDFNIWWGWWLKKRKVLGPLIFAITMVVSFVGAIVFIFSFLPIFKEEATYLLVRARIIAGILTPIFFYLYINCFVSGPDNNYRMAIDEAKEFAAGEPQYSSRIAILIRETRETKDPKKINECIKNWLALSSHKKWMQKLKEKKESIERGDSLKKVEIEIEATQKTINELEAKLA